MSKKIVKIEIEDETLLAQIKGTIGNECACFVLISCSKPTSDGQMDVKMHFEGDECLASFLVDNASQVFEERVTKRESK